MEITQTQKRQRTQWATQFLAAAELVRRGYTVAFTMGNHTPIADLMVGTRSGQQFWVDVKGLTSKTDWLFKPKSPRNQLYYVLVFLTKLAEHGKERKPDEFYIMTQETANKLEADYRAMHPNNKTTMPGFKYKDALMHKDSWHILPPAE